MECEDGGEYGVGPVGGGVCGPALMGLVTEEEELAALEELPVGPVVILRVDGQES